MKETARTWAELQQSSDIELITEHDKEAQNVRPPLSYYLEEMRFRHLNRHSETILKYTKHVKWMTVIITFATIINVIVLIISLGLAKG
jgi:hypothetical protein